MWSRLWFRMTFRASDSPSDWRAEVTVRWWCGPALPLALNHGVCFTTVYLVSWTKVNWRYCFLSCYRIFTWSLRSWLLAVMPNAPLVYKSLFDSLCLHAMVTTLHLNIWTAITGSEPNHSGDISVSYACNHKNNVASCVMQFIIQNNMQGGGGENVCQYAAWQVHREAELHCSKLEHQGLISANWL